MSPQEAADILTVYLGGRVANEGGFYNPDTSSGGVQQAIRVALEALKGGPDVNVVSTVTLPAKSVVDGELVSGTVTVPVSPSINTSKVDAAVFTTDKAKEGTIQPKFQPPITFDKK